MKPLVLHNTAGITGKTVSHVTTAEDDNVDKHIITHYKDGTFSAVKLTAHGFTAMIEVAEEFISTDSQDMEESGVFYSQEIADAEKKYDEADRMYRMKKYLEAKRTYMRLKDEFEHENLQPES